MKNHNGTINNLERRVAAVSKKQQELRERIVNVENRSMKLIASLSNKYSVVPLFEVVGGEACLLQYL